MPTEKQHEENFLPALDECSLPLPSSEPISPIDSWVQNMIQATNRLSRNPELHSILRKRSF